MNHPSREHDFQLERHLFFWTTHVSVLYAVHMRKAMRKLRVNLPTWRALAVLSEIGPSTLTDLAAATVVERTALTRTVAQMEGRGLIAREADRTDRRRSRIAITPAGSELYRKIVPIFDSMQSRSMGTISPASIRSIVSTLRQVAHNIEGSPYDPLARRHDMPPEELARPPERAARKSARGRRSDGMPV